MDFKLKRTLLIAQRPKLNLKDKEGMMGADCRPFEAQRRKNKEVSGGERAKIINLQTTAYQTGE